MSRSGSVRLRSALGSSTTTTTTTKGEPSTSSGDPSAMGSSGYLFPETAGAAKATSRSSNRRTLNNNNNVIHSNNNSNGSNGPGSGVLVNGTASVNNSSGSQVHHNTNHSTALTSTSTRSQSTRSSAKDKVLPPSASMTSASPMEVGEDDVDAMNSCSVSQPQSEPAVESTINSGVDKQQLVPSSTGLAVTSGVVAIASDPNNSTNQSNVSTSISFPSSLLEAVNAAMEVDAHEDSSSPSSSSESSDSSDSDDSSEMDEDNCEKKRVECHEDMHDMEKQFTYLRELLYKERLCSVDEKLEEVRSGRSREYLGPLQKLQENMSVRIEVTASLREFRLGNLKHKSDAEEIGGLQNYASQKSLLYDSIKSDLADKIRRLEEDRNNDFSSELWLDAALKRKNKKSVDIFGEKKKKPVVVTGPYVVYMLNDIDIVEDLSVIKKVLSAPKRKYVDPVVQIF